MREREREFSLVAQFVHVLNFSVARLCIALIMHSQAALKFWWENKLDEREW